MGLAATFDDRFRRRIWRICAASVLMGAMLFGLVQVLEPALNTAGLRYLALTGVVAAAIVFFFGVGQVIGAFRLAEFRNAMRRRR